MRRSQWDDSWWSVQLVQANGSMRLSIFSRSVQLSWLKMSTLLRTRRHRSLTSREKRLQEVIRLPEEDYKVLVMLELGAQNGRGSADCLELFHPRGCLMSGYSVLPESVFRGSLSVCCPACTSPSEVLYRKTVAAVRNSTLYHIKSGRCNLLTVHFSPSEVGGERAKKIEDMFEEVCQRRYLQQSWLVHWRRSNKK